MKRKNPGNHRPRAECASSTASTKKKTVAKKAKRPSPDATARGRQVLQAFARLHVRAAFWPRPRLRANPALGR